jgi:hypothetical protein
VILFDVAPGLSVVADADGQMDRAALEELAASVRLAPDPGDPATWPTRPVR